MRLSLIYIGGRTKPVLQRAIRNDTTFLMSVNVMDYSLLVGVDKENQKFVFGIIDYLRQYTWDKQTGDIVPDDWSTVKNHSGPVNLVLVVTVTCEKLTARRLIIELKHALLSEDFLSRLSSSSSGLVILILQAVYIE